ncbi:hypothetical protein CAPTEDRAFT_199395 [Capitella teleta]|uniref:Uncharacterized protein n=1 Tax=Capitella teleta TaxID=283909 RepID=R7V537_CAPTE|nr:hypothetical protein CAPTEDRAFT_199395 [Capitella teleta]|eukprot:ELU10895.1 hypothetical protein CAPTEDRAFT_199395 [Capitella teleta]
MGYSILNQLFRSNCSSLVEPAYKPAALEPKEAEASQAEEEVKESGDDAGASSAEELDQEEQACTEKYLILVRNLAQENNTGVIEKCRAVIDAGSKYRYVPGALLCMPRSCCFTARENNLQPNSLNFS